MKSTIKIDVDQFNNPVIIVKQAMDTEDLRDKMLKRFFEELGGESTTLHVKVESNSYSLTNPEDITHVHWVIRPVSEIKVSKRKK